MTHDTNTDDTVTYRPPLRRVIRGLISDYRHVTTTNLVVMVHAETGAAPDLIRDVVDALEREGEIYNGGDSWKVTRP